MSDDNSTDDNSTDDDFTDDNSTGDNSTGDNFTEVSSTGWFARIGSSIAGMVVGIIPVVIAFTLLWWNEGSSVHTYQGLAEGEKIALDASADRVDSANNGKLVHVTGRARGKDKVVDDAFGVSSLELIKLNRRVELYQWIEKKESETKKKFGGSEETITEYSYKKDWDSKVHRSTEFRKPGGHTNPSPVYATQSFSSRDASLGAFHLPDFLISGWNDYKPHPLPAPDQLPAPLHGKATVRGDWLYVGADADTPKVGDARVKFESIPAGDASVLASQVNETFQPYATTAGTSIARISSGVQSKELMFAAAQTDNNIITWVLRGAGFLLMFLGLAFILNPLKVLADVIPFIGSLVGAGTATIAFFLSVTGSSLTISLAWVWYRPVVGIAMLAVAAGAIHFLRGAIRKKSAA